MKKLIRYFKRVGHLLELGWYRNMSGGFTEGHCMGFLSRKELFNMTDEEFEMIK